MVEIGVFKRSDGSAACRPRGNGSRCRGDDQQRSNRDRCRRPSGSSRACARPGPLLAIEGVTVGFGGVVALDRVGFDVARRAVSGLIGPNGAGKTTLFIVCRDLPLRARHDPVRGESPTRYSVHRIAALGMAERPRILRCFEPDGARKHHDRRSLPLAPRISANAVGLPLVRREERGLQDRAAELARFWVWSPSAGQWLRICRSAFRSASSPRGRLRPDRNPAAG